MKLDIIDDTDLNISCEITIDGKKYYHRPGNETISYESTSLKPIELKVLKEDIWVSEQRLNSVLLIIYVFDWTFGNLSESDNLPFWIDHRVLLKTENINIPSKILLSNMVKVNDESLASWSKYSALQCILIIIILLAIGGVLSFMFEGWIKIGFMVCIAFISSFVFKLIYARRKKLLHVLKMYI